MYVCASAMVCAAAMRDSAARAIRRRVQTYDAPELTDERASSLTDFTSNAQ